jgi:hypothetical protein
VLPETLLLARYDGALNGAARLPLCDWCPNAATCWAGIPDSSKLRGEEGCVSLPWIGRDYQAHRVLVVGINFNGYGGLRANWDVCADHQRQQAAGRPGKDSRPFAHAAASYANAILKAQAGCTPPPAPPRPQAVSGVWDRIAFAQGVKCAPCGNRSRPTDAMIENCPSLLLAHELDVLRPRSVVALGRGRMRDGIRPLLAERFDLSYGEAPGRLERDRFSIRDQPAELFCLDHPSYPRWRVSYGQLIVSLGKRRPA